ncbi:phosphatase PAP2 family protein [Streptomyces sp. NP160]|uniref:phosphatase PAP2 family protein n=1 Tax=Streptomyces sp. NP160 TaxID=2586637 RepID=UPI0015D5C0AC|nr:phosphatase PAP2 family protein [Streptomyces sp. NP160]
MVAFLVAYESVQRLAGDDVAAAFAHARALLGVEQALGLAPEQVLDRAVAASPVLSLLSAAWYSALHYTVTPAVLALAYWRLPALYRAVRNAFFATTAAALAGYFLLPTAPPRLLAGYVDVVSATAGTGWWSAAPPVGTSGVDQLAAMPSMHVGWSLWCALVLLLVVRRRWLRTVVLLHPAVTVLVVLGTGNHWLLDVVAGAALTALSWTVLVRCSAADGTAAAARAGDGRDLVREPR